MKFEPSDRARACIERVDQFMHEHIYPAEAVHISKLRGNRWAETPIVRSIRAKAKAAGLWNLFLPQEYTPYSPGLTNLEYAPLAELMGRSEIGAVAFNCEADAHGHHHYPRPVRRAINASPTVSRRLPSFRAASIAATELSVIGFPLRALQALRAPARLPAFWTA
jgi:alkylation response protein AidB-like acyl-CoA dehydrogenase